MTDSETEKVAQSLAMMFHCFPQSAVANVDMQMEAYLHVLEDYDFPDVVAAIDRVSKGGEGHEGRSFVPSTAELCQEVRRRREIREIQERRAHNGLRVIKSAETF